MHWHSFRWPQCCCSVLVTLLMVAAVSTVDCIKVRVWTNVTASDFVYPEVDPRSDFGIDALMERPSLGIAISGGGWRAAALAYGWLRALHLMNITHKAQYISANSGATWVTTPYAYTKTPLNRFFSPYFEPHNLTTSRLSMSLTPGSWGSRVAGKTLLLGALGNPGKPQ
eukprot:GHUV01002137.1.p1 GENE.GHUV01002137.1~~GHUV01002137.1.p1  ORF type:complete len:169 (+),score=19.58 GHUV01002137.1:1223-1729(+)